jgi:LacI family transcriptional regulator, repressor for deo operon, udp, cdd, tsx, nupC, and nupG
MTAKIGIREIAEKAGVSIATVSHAFRNPQRVSTATRERVLAAAAEVGYTPNSLAVSLRTARSGNIVVIIPDVADSHNSGIIKAIEKVARSRGYSVLLGDTQGSAKREREFAAMTRSRQADGIILMSHRLPFDLTDANISLDDLPPIVSGCEFTGYGEFPSVTIDDYAAAVDATNHLIGYGHERIAVITGDMESTSSKDRLRGFREAMAAAGLEVDDRLVVLGGYTVQCGESAAKELLMQRARPTAVFCFSDEIALGCMYALQQQGFGVPNDISVMGFDNIPFAKYFVPSLTTIAQPTEEIGTICATVLLDLIEGKKPGKRRYVLPHELLVRESTRQLH